LDRYGIKGSLLSTIKSFLTNQFQRVKIGKYFSEKLKLSSGVPHGSVLGPLLLIIYINDLPKTLSNCNNISSNLFADNLKSFTTYNNYLSDPQCLQLDIDQLLEWSQSWQLELAATKCNSLFIKGTSNHVDIANFYIKGLCLTNSDTVKDLGV